MLTDIQIEQYRRDGYTVYPHFFDAAEVDNIRAELDHICAGNTRDHFAADRMEMEPNQAPRGTAVRRVYEPCTHYDLFDTLSRSGRLINCIEALIGPDILRHYSKINMKPAEIGSVVEWHQDLSYYPLTNGDSVAVLFYLDDTNVENGCLKMIPGVHEEPLLDHTRDGFFQGRITEDVDESKAVAVEGEAGNAIFMHAMTPHASATNTSDASRRTLIISYRATDACPIYYGDGTAKAVAHEKLVRGIRKPSARFTFTNFPIPVYEKLTASLYELQEISREES